MEKTLLLVDDDNLIIKLYKRFFEIAGFRVLTASNLKEAEEKIKANKFDAAVLDIKLGNDNGFDVLALIRADEKNKRAKIVMFSAFADKPETEEHCERAGVVCVTKGEQSPNHTVRIITEMLVK